MIRNKRGEISKIVTVVVGILLFAILFPIAMGNIANTQYTYTSVSGVVTQTYTWNSAVQTIFNTLTPILVAIAVALVFLRTIKR